MFLHNFSSLKRSLRATSIALTLVASMFATDKAACDEIPSKVLQGIQAHLAENSWPSIYYDVVPKVINKHKFKNIVEIGVALGGHAEAILANTNVEIYYGIDPYIYNYDPNDSFSSDVAKYSSFPGQRNFDYLYQWVKDYRLSQYGSRCALLRQYSIDAAASFDDGSIDCIFIDGMHTYDNVMTDLVSWYPKLRKGGIILGDDYWMEQVANAVNDYFKQQGKRVFFIVSKSGYKIWTVYK